MHRLSKSPLSEPPAQSLLNDTAAFLRDGRVMLERSRVKVFVCGGRLDDQGNSRRRDFLRWVDATNSHSELEIVLAEEAYAVASVETNHRFINIGEFENILAELSDCILLFPESVGSYAEAGLFSGDLRLCGKVLVANNRQPHNSTSFLSLGPLHAFSTKSVFANIVVLSDLEHDHPADYAGIKQRIIERSARTRKRVLLTGDISQHSYREQISLVLLIIKITGFITALDLRKMVSSMLFSVKKDELNEIIRILSSFKQIKVLGKGYYKFTADNRFSLFIEESRGKFTRLQGAYRDHYAKSHSDFFRMMVGADAD